MAQISLREYDVKQMFARYAGTFYSGIQIRDISDIEKLGTEKKYVLKPDMLFGKRGKRGMVGINLARSEAKKWLTDWYKKEVNIDGVLGTLDVFLAEEMLPIKQEYYLSFAQSRDGDVVTFSPAGGVDIEENWETTKSIVVKVNDELGENSLNSLLQGEKKLQELISSLFDFYRTHGFTSLEFNPIAEDTSGNFHLLDAVAKIDDCEHFLQKEHWTEIEFPNNFGFQESAAERYIRELDMQTGASLKLKILNPNASIWTLFAGGGGSLVMTDSLGALGYAGEIGNYGELSGNPTREFTREYVRVLLQEVLKAKPLAITAPYNHNQSHEIAAPSVLRTPPSSKEDNRAATSSLLDKEGIEGGQKKYLIIAGAIANFTDIATTFQGVIDILQELQEPIRAQKIEILVRRGGINEKKGLELLKTACERLHIPAHITGSEHYMTDILKKIIL